MPIFTPRGLKIRLPLDYAFTLLARLYPKVDAFKVLKTTEGIEVLPSMVSFLIGIVCFALRADPVTVGIAIFIGHLSAVIVNLSGFYAIPGLVPMGTLFSYVSGFGILFLLSLFGLSFAGWESVAAFFVGKALSWGIAQISEFANTKRLFKATGIPLTASEQNFLNAYRIHASGIGVTTDVSVSEEELKEENWREVLEDFMRRWPEVAARIS